MNHSGYVYGITYKYTNLIDWKAYVGQTRFPGRRIAQHRAAKDDSVFHQAIRRHGIENFQYEPLQNCSSRAELNRSEIENIRWFRTDEEKFGYNQTTGGNHANWTESAKGNARSAQYEVRGRRIEELTDQGFTAGNIAEMLYLSREAVECIAEENGIELLDDCWRGALTRALPDQYLRREDYFFPGESFEALATGKFGSCSYKALRRHIFSAPDRLLVEDAPSFVISDTDDDEDECDEFDVVA